ncbi:MAG: 2-oxoacid:acceptor oxidoreductase subunit alpha [Desulfurococcales archaeon]|nr:2-oxoacid:acceptor oxidoreductase subunit alpha [Desulfurococcales archaeon]
MANRRNEVTALLGGPQGAGLETAAQVLSTAFAITGRYVYSYREYYSNIKGRHTYIYVRISSERLPQTAREYPDIIAAIDAESIFHHFTEAREGTIIIYDTSTVNTKINGIVSIEPETRNRISSLLESSGYEKTVKGALQYAEERGAKLIGLDYKLLLKEFAQKTGKSTYRARRYLNTIPMAATGYLLGLTPGELEKGFRRRFRGREQIVADNVKLAEIVAGYMREMGFKPSPLPEPTNPPDKFLVVSGNDIVAIAKTIAGLRLQTYYPITPAADESVTLEAHENLRVDGEDLGSVLVFQTEDEIAAISAAIGAALTGVRSSTTTSGPGFDLMIEALGWAGINEVPVVVTYYQRGGPSTGLPTRGGQEDLFNALFSGHGLFPKIVLASGDHVEAYEDTIRAFNWAEEYQLPVIHLLDKFLANSIVTLPPNLLPPAKISRGLISTGGRGYNRFDKSGGPITPRAFIGSEETVIWYTGDEHNTEGHITEDPENRIIMHDYRMRKLELADEQIPEEERYRLYGNGKDFLLVGWGSVKGAALEALKHLDEEGLHGAYLHVRVMQPLPKKAISKILSDYGVDRAILVEASVRPLLGRLIPMWTGFQFERFILKWTGRPIYPLELAGAVSHIIRDGSRSEVLRYGA